MKVDGSDVRQLTHSESDYEPAWSPDSTRIAFIRDYARSSLWLVDADGTNQHHLKTPFRSPCERSSAPDWSPDGHWIAFTRTCIDDVLNEHSSNIFVVRPEGTGLRPLTNASLQRNISNDSPAWSPDGKRIVFVSYGGASRDKASHSDIYVMNADGTGQKRRPGFPVGPVFRIGARGDSTASARCRSLFTLPAQKRRSPILGVERRRSSRRSTPSSRVAQ
jgi:Tol biopolymer transport system component